MATKLQVLTVTPFSYPKQGGAMIKHSLTKVAMLPYGPVRFTQECRTRHGKPVARDMLFRLNVAAGEVFVLYARSLGKSQNSNSTS